MNHAIKIAMKQFLLLFAILFPSIINWGQTVSIGDILCTDGSTVKPVQYASSGKTAWGVVFHVDATDTHGWAVALNNQSSSIKWCSNDYYGYDIPELPNFENARTAMHDLDGYTNTGIIRNVDFDFAFPAAWAVDYDNDWYLPSAGQLRYLFSCAPEINASLQVVGGTELPYHSNRYWWSSTEFTECHAYDMNTGGSLGDYVKDNHVNYPPNGIAVRQIRDFQIQQPVHPTYHIGDIITNDDGSRGILFYINPDQNDGWMVALNDASSSIPWGSSIDIPGLANQTCSQPFGALLDETNGFANTESIRNHQSGMTTAANAVDFTHGWYLPTGGQLLKLFGSLAFIEDKLQAYGNTLAEDYYWSSSEADASQAFALSCAPMANVRAGHCVRTEKTSHFRVRAVRNIVFENPNPVPGLPDNILESDCNHPMEGNAWNVMLIHSTPEDVASYAPVMAGDIDSNGVVDILISHFNGNNYRTNTLDVYSGIDLSLQYRFNIQDSIYNTTGNYALCRYPLPNGSQQGAIFVHSYDRKIRSYSINGTLLNVSDRPTSCDGMVSFADFNGDGFPEVYAGSDIFDAATLKWLCSGPENGNKGESYRGSAPGVVNSHRCYYAMSLAADVLGNAQQELICGNTIYNVNIVSRTNPNLNSITVNKTITPPSGYSPDGHVSLADFDLDGECEVLVTRNDTDDHTMGTVYFYAFKPSNGQIIFQKTVQCLCTGYPLIGNIDDDPHPEIVFLEKQESWQPMYIYCWRYTLQTGLTTVWQHQHDDSSGQTGITLFDFNQDDIMELVYRDSNNLRIINGSGKSHITGNDTIRPYNIFTRMMAAGTGCEYPIVADVNGDGSAEIVVSGMLDQYAYLPGVGGLHMFGNPGNWAPARPVWNQYMYHVTNINEDLTIPTFCFDKATVFTGPDGTIRRPYNNFLQQAGYITPTGEPYNPSSFVETEHYGEGCDTYSYHGVTYNESGDYEYYIENPLGCDTLMTVHVHIGDTVHAMQYKSVCQPYTWNGITYEASGVYQQTFTSAQGCDSIVTLYLNVGEQIMNNIAVNTCDSYTWNGTTYTESGLYQQTFTSSQGCDSIVFLDLTIKGSSYVSQIHGQALIYYKENGLFVYNIDPVNGCFGYEWSLDGPWSITSSPDSPECTVNINSPGSATLKVRVYSECGVTERVLFINHDARPDVVIYPNPNDGDFNIVLYGMQGNAVIIIYDCLGQFLGRFEVNTDLAGIVVPYSLTGHASGLYFVAVTNDYRTITKKVVKATPATHGYYNWNW